ncbi:uncharacterized protein MYCFIDRAFT_173306 [Pseudocercospora fijiensis CIRAD86]|uniref:Uncharacterized protein n=1 Tax=Pseudocercospora fijiensis (strain CIRAD86) TaxID=383855 RepID=M2ZZF5_PSEFD|nr:uncharacterized protein MYCFIDRAFT_173306 [Pseudocercospora fijiensis CIRAD86]EME84284.1 hypothetical protein MYCFIDRAFT_173306 [Pseudocercospora fijiensis CIRAD86]
MLQASSGSARYIGPSGASCCDDLFRQFRRRSIRVQASFCFETKFERFVSVSAMLSHQYQSRIFQYPSAGPQKSLAFLQAWAIIQKQRQRCVVKATIDNSSLHENAPDAISSLRSSTNFSKSTFRQSGRQRNLEEGQTPKRNTPAGSRVFSHTTSGLAHSPRGIDNIKWPLSVPVQDASVWSGILKEHTQALPIGLTLKVPVDDDRTPRSSERAIRKARPDTSSNLSPVLPKQKQAQERKATWNRPSASDHGLVTVLLPFTRRCYIELSRELQTWPNMQADLSYTLFIGDQRPAFLTHSLHQTSKQNVHVPPKTTKKGALQEQHHAPNQNAIYDQTLRSLTAALCASKPSIRSPQQHGQDSTNRQPPVLRKKKTAKALKKEYKIASASARAQLALAIVSMNLPIFEELELTPRGERKRKRLYRAIIRDKNRDLQDFLEAKKAKKRKSTKLRAARLAKWDLQDRFYVSETDFDDGASEASDESWSSLGSFDDDGDDYGDDYDDDDGYDSGMSGGLGDMDSLQGSDDLSDPDTDTDGGIGEADGAQDTDNLTDPDTDVVHSTSIEWQNWLYVTMESFWDQISMIQFAPGISSRLCRESFFGQAIFDLVFFHCSCQSLILLMTLQADGIWSSFVPAIEGSSQAYPTKWTEFRHDIEMSKVTTCSARNDPASFQLHFQGAKVREHPFAGRIGGNQELCLDPDDEAVKKQPDAAPIISLSQSLDPPGFLVFEYYKMGLIEGPGTCLLVFVSGAGANALTTLGDSVSPMAIALYAALMNWVALTLFVYTTAPASGGHLNPSITLGTLFAGLSSLPRSLIYVVSQSVGAIVGGFWLRLGLGKSGYFPSGVVPGCTVDQQLVSRGQLFVLEYVFALAQLFLAFGVGLGPRNAKTYGPAFAPVLVGLTLALGTLASAFVKEGYSGICKHHSRLVCLTCQKADRGDMQYNYLHWFATLAACMVHGVFYHTVPPYKKSSGKARREALPSFSIMQVKKARFGPSVILGRDGENGRALKHDQVSSRSPDCMDEDLIVEIWEASLDMTVSCLRCTFTSMVL